MFNLISKRRRYVLCLACIGLVACTPDPAPAPDQDGVPSEESAPSKEGVPDQSAAEPKTAQLADAVVGKWTRSCALCHINGEGGAPRMGVADEWQPRLAQGEEVLLAHTIEGFNSMPPLGYCMACERDDLKALTDFMAGDAQ